MTIAAATGVREGSTRIRAIGSSRSSGSASAITRDQTPAVPTTGHGRIVRRAIHAEGRVRTEGPAINSGSATIAGRTMPEDHDPIAALPVRAMRETIDTRGPTVRVRTGERGAIDRRAARIDHATDRPRDTDRPRNTDRPQNADRPRSGDRPRNTDRPRGDWRPPSTDRPRNADRPHADRPRSGDRPRNTDRPRGDWRPPGTDRPRNADRPHHADRPRSGDRPRNTDRPRGDWRPPGTDRPRNADRPGRAQRRSAHAIRIGRAVTGVPLATTVRAMPIVRATAIVRAVRIVRATRPSAWHGSPSRRLASTRATRSKVESAQVRQSRTREPSPARLAPRTSQSTARSRPRSA